MPTHRRTKSLLRHSPVSSGNIRIHLTKAMSVERNAFAYRLTTCPDIRVQDIGGIFLWCGTSLSSVGTGLCAESPPGGRRG